MHKEELIKQCSEYFKSNPGFTRVLIEIKDKYRSLGKIGGTIKIHNLTIEEKEALTGFLKKNYYRDSASIRLDKFQEAFNNTPFEGLDLVEVLEEYFGRYIITKKEEIEIYERNKETFFNEILDETNGTRAYEWLDFVINTKENANRTISQRYHSDKEELKKDLLSVAKGINSLPFLSGHIKRLALFATEVGKNPHLFDDNTECGKLLLYGIVYLLGLEYPENAEERTETYYKAGLIKDEVSNYTMCSGLLAYKDGQIHLGWKGFYDSGEPLQVSLWNLSNIEKVLSLNRKVFVFENPTVFSEVLHRTYEEKPSLVCTYGQVKLASLILLDKLVEEGTNIYYSGDFDPEGLIIADKLKNRYGQNLTIWRYGIDEYNKSISKEKINNTRMKKLNNLINKELISISEFIKQRGYSGYQEMILDELIGDIKKLLKS